MEDGLMPDLIRDDSIEIETWVPERMEFLLANYSLSDNQREFIARREAGESPGSIKESMGIDGKSVSTIAYQVEREFAAWVYDSPPDANPEYPLESKQAHTEMACPECSVGLVSRLYVAGAPHPLRAIQDDEGKWFRLTIGGEVHILDAGIKVEAWEEPKDLRPVFMESDAKWFCPWCAHML